MRTRHSKLFLWTTAIMAFVGLMALVKLLPSLLTASTGGALFRESVLISAGVAATVVLIRVAHEPASMMGIRRSRATTIGFALLMFVAAMLVNAAVVFAAHAGPGQGGGKLLTSLANRPVWLLSLIALTAAISEEIVFRGIMLTHIEAATGSTWIGALISLAAFAGAHAGGWGVSYVAIAALPGLLLTLFFLWRRDLIANILVHFLIDGAGLMALAATSAHHT